MAPRPPPWPLPSTYSNTSLNIVCSARLLSPDKFIKNSPTEAPEKFSWCHYSSSFVRNKGNIVSSKTCHQQIWIDCLVILLLWWKSLTSQSMKRVLSEVSSPAWRDIFVFMDILSLSTKILSFLILTMLWKPNFLTSNHRVRDLSHRRPRNWLMRT